MVFPSWRQRLVRSLHISRSQPQSKFYQVASVSLDGAPKNRTMVFRGFLADSLSLISITDTRSDKIKEWSLQENKESNAEICWYFASTREQYRIATKITLVTKDNIQMLIDQGARFGETNEGLMPNFVSERWRLLSESARQQFFLAAPKAPFDEPTTNSYPKATSNESQTNKSDNNNTADSTLDISDNFCVVIFTPISVDYLNLKTTPQLRCLSDVAKNWVEVVVNA